MTIPLGRNRLLVILYVLIFTLASSVRAKSTVWEFGADVQFESIYWTQNYGENTNASLNRLQLVPLIKGKPRDWLRVYIKPELFWDPQNNSAEERVFLNLGEAYVRVSDATQSLQVGSSIVNWGVTDGYNPLDVVNSRQYYDPLRSKKLGAVGALYSHASDASGDIGLFEEELIFIPVAQAPMLPGTESRWLPRQVFIPWSPDSHTELILPGNLRYRYDSTQVLDEALKNNVGARLQWHLSGIDLSVIGFEGVSDFPLVGATVTGDILSFPPRTVIKVTDVGLKVTHFRQQVGGYSWVSAQYGFLFKYAASYSKSLGTDPSLPGWEHRNILALEKNFQPTDSLAITGILQYSFVNSERSSDSNLSINEIFRRAWMAGFRLSYGDTWTATALALYDTVHFSHFQNLTIARRFKDVWTVQANGILISGPPDTPLGVYEQNDSLALSVSRSF